MSTFLHGAVDAAPFSWIAAAGTGVALVSCLLALLLRARLATPQRRRAIPLLVCALALLTAIGAAIAGVDIGRGDLAEQLVAREAPAVASDITRGIARQLAGLALLGPIALVSLLSAGLLRLVFRKGPSRSAFARRSRARHGRGAAAAPRRSWRVHLWIVGARRLRRDRLRGSAQQGIRDARTTAAGVSLAAPDAREHRGLGGRGLDRGCRVGAIGGTSAARPRWDGDSMRPVRCWHGSLHRDSRARSRSGATADPDEQPTKQLRHRVLARDAAVLSLPAASPGAPVLEFSANAVLFNRGLVSPGEFAEKLATQRSLLPLLHPGEPLPPPELLVLADVATPTDRVIPYLERAGEIRDLHGGRHAPSLCVEEARSHRSAGVLLARHFLFERTGRR